MHLHSLELFEGSGPHINNCLWGLIEEIDGIETKTRVMFRPKTNEGGMVACVPSKLLADGKPVAEGYEEIRSYLKNNCVAVPNKERRPAIAGGLTPIAAV